MRLSVRSANRPAKEHERLAAWFNLPSSSCEAFAIVGKCRNWHYAVQCCGTNSFTDVLLRFKRERNPGFLGVVRMRRGLAVLLAVRVDLSHLAAVEDGRNYILWQVILESIRVIYAT